MGDWRKKIDLPLEQVLRVSKEVFGKTSFDAGMQLMHKIASSASSLTPIGTQRTRKMIPRDSDYVLRGVTYKGSTKALEYYTQKKRGVQVMQLPPDYLPQLQDRILAKMWPIRRRGLAKKSWMYAWNKNMYGLAKHPPSDLDVFRSGEREISFRLRNFLSYLEKILPPMAIQRAIRNGTRALLGWAEKTYMKRIGQEVIRAWGR
jgi:hypothetical protein